MAYFLNLFTPETWRAFRDAGERVTGGRPGRRRLLAENIGPGDVFLCYLTRLSRWCGVLQVDSSPYDDDTCIHPDLDPFTVRFAVSPLVTLDPEMSIPIYEDIVWNKLSITRQYEKGHRQWTGFFRTTWNKFDDADGVVLRDLLMAQRQNPNVYPLTEKDQRQLSGRQTIRTPERAVEIEIPEEDEDAERPATAVVVEIPESTQMQAKVAQIGAEMGFHIWVPRHDKARILEHVPEAMHDKFLSQLPLNYDGNTLRTIEQIDVLWLRGRSMARAFEIEHTTAIYSGLLRMADLLALQPNMDIRLHIVAQDERRERVLREVRRPVFSLLEGKPLYERCSFLSYDSINSLSSTPYLSHMSDTVISEYEETTEV